MHKVLWLKTQKVENGKNKSIQQQMCGQLIGLNNRNVFHLDVVEKTFQALSVVF